MSPEWTKHGEGEHFPSLCLNHKNTHTMETQNDGFDVWLGIDNGKILLCSTIEKDVTDFVKDYEFTYGYEIQVVKIFCHN